MPGTEGAADVEAGRRDTGEASEGRRDSGSWARGRRVTIARRSIQGLFLAAFAALAFATAYPPLRVPAANLLLRLDPLAAIVTLLTSPSLQTVAHFWPAFLLLGATILSARFFCGWLCPLGTCFDAAGAVKPRALKYYKPGAPELRKVREASRGGSVRSLRASFKYLFLAAVLVLAALGVNLLYVGSPMVIVNRTAYQVLSGSVPFLFIALLGVAFLWRPRFWCEDLCPMGALMSLFSMAGKRLPARWSPLAVAKRPAACTSCGACYRECEFGVAEPYVTPRRGRLLSADCTSCGRCVEACGAPGALELDSFGIRLATSGKERPEANAGRATHPSTGTRFTIERREFLTSAGLGALLVAGYGIGLRPSGDTPLRMPGAQDESRFVERCARCEACARACPAQCLEPMGLSAGLQKMWTPRFVPAKAGCIFDQCDFACTKVCPVGAIEPVAVEDVKIGLAHVQKGTCLGWLGRPCLVCFERCRFNAIEMDGDRPMVRKEKCTGCGACEETCPTTPGSIRVSPSGGNGGGQGRGHRGG